MHWAQNMFCDSKDVNRLNGRQLRFLQFGYCIICPLLQLMQSLVHDLQDGLCVAAMIIGGLMAGCVLAMLAVVEPDANMLLYRWSKRHH